MTGELAAPRDRHPLVARVEALALLAVTAALLAFATRLHGHGTG